MLKALGQRLWKFKTLAVLGASWLATLGAIGVLDIAFLKIFGEENTLDSIISPSWYWTIVTSISLVIAFVKRWPVLKAKISISDTDAQISVVVGDLFSGMGAIVVPVNTCFDTSLESGIISDDSVIGQFVKNGFMPMGQLNAHIENELRNIPSTLLTDGRRGKTRRYPLGTVVGVETADRKYFLLAMADCNEHGQTTATEFDVSQAIAVFWDYIRERGGVVSDLRMPVIGSGRGRLRSSREELVANQISSFLAALAESGVGTDLVCVIHTTDWESKNVSLERIQEFLNVKSREFKIQPSAPGGSSVTDHRLTVGRIVELEALEDGGESKHTSEDLTEDSEKIKE